MSAPNSTLAATDPVIDLRRKHQGFLARIGTNPPDATEIEAFMVKLQEAGRFLPDTADDKRRGAVRNMLFYWAGDAIARGHRPKNTPLPQLADFVGANAGEGSAGAEPTPEAIRPEKIEPAKPEAQPQPQSTTSPPAEPRRDEGIGSSESTQSKPSSGLGGLIGSMLGGKPEQSGLSGVLGGLIGTGARKGNAMGKRGAKATRAPKETTRELSPSPAEGAAEKPQDDRPLTDIEAIARARIILRYAGSARQWRQIPPEKRADYLLTGTRLAEASLYVNDDPDIRAHVAASEEARDAAVLAENAAREAAHAERSKLQKHRIYALSVLVIAAAAVAVAFWDKNRRLERAIAERDKADQARELAFESFDARQRQQSAPQSSASNISESPQRPAPPLEKPAEVPVPTSLADPCSGYLWLGSVSESRLMNGQSPATLKPGDRATINLADDIRLRETAPSFNYQMGRQNGLVPAGSTVTIESLLAPIPRASGAQYWAQVLAPRQFCTSVFVQYTGAAPAKLSGIKGELLNIGVQVPPAEELASARGKADVRYYWVSDMPVAQQIATTLGKLTKDGKPLRLTPLTDFPPAAKAKATTIEVWLDLDMLKP